MSDKQLDVTALNAPLVDMYKAAYGDRPAGKRESGAAVLLYDEVTARYVGLSKSDKAQAYNNLAYELRRLGYGHEVIHYSLLSIIFNPTEFNQVSANQGFIAYAEGMMLGNYQRGLDVYSALDTRLRAAGAFDDTAAIKSAQNKGQIYHRMGMNDPDAYLVADKCFDDASKLLEKSTSLSDVQKNQFRAQIGYCRAKTLTHLAAHDDESASMYLTDAKFYIDESLSLIEGNTNFEFELACFLAVRGGVYAAMNMMPEARADLDAALSGQLQYGPTLAPRIASTMFKLADVNLSQADRLRNKATALLVAFYGNEHHPDLASYGLGSSAVDLAPAALKPPRL